jgi:hypothetical protein
MTETETETETEVEAGNEKRTREVLPKESSTPGGSPK